MRKNFVWIVEMRDGAGSNPTVGVALTRLAAEDIERDWRQRNPDDKFRVVKYEAWMSGDEGW